MNRPLQRSLVLVTALAATAAACNAAQGDTAPTRTPDVIFVPTPDDVIDKMLRMAKVGPDDVVYDLGCGDGRIAVAAARDFGARAVCVEIDPQRITEARERIRREGVEDKVEIRHADLFKVDVSPATVVTLYLLETLNMKLRPKLKRELRNGARVVSQSFSMGDWKPVEQTRVGDKPVYLWKIEKGQHARKGANKSRSRAAR
jgi:SAM-dependent methyltransferase